MYVTIVAFARIAELLGDLPRRLALSERADAGDAWDAVAAGIPELHVLRASTRVVRNGEFATFDEPLRDGDEVAFLPPFGGG